MAEDLHALFGLSDSATTISGANRNGVALPAIQELNRVVLELRRENAMLKEQFAKKGASLGARLAALEALMAKGDSVAPR